MRLRLVHRVICAIWAVTGALAVLLMIGSVGIQLSAAWAKEAHAGGAAVKKSTEAAATQPKAALSDATYPRRSPFPEPGETISTPIPYRVMPRPGEKRAAKAAAKTEERKPEKRTSEKPAAVVPWSEASAHLGETIVAEGKIIDAHNTGSVCFLNFSRNRDLFYVILFKDTLEAWPEPPQKYFLQKTIRVRGEVKENKGKAQIQVRDPKQIEVVEDTKP